MSTRCQVKVIQLGEEVTLYHHTDGYPDRMIPTIHKAFNYTRLNFMGEEDKCEWRKGRAGMVASFLSWADPGVFEPEQGHELHGDIAFYYKLYVIPKAEWEVEILVPEDEFWNVPIEKNMKILTERTPLEELALEYVK